MPDNVLLNKAATVERCIARARLALSLPILVGVITGHLDEFIDFTQTILQQDAARRK